MRRKVNRKPAPEPQEEEQTTLLSEVKESKKAAEVPIDEMPLTNLGEYMRYNRAARAENKRLRIARYPIKQCPVELHPTDRVIFERVDQPGNPLPVFLSNDMIHFEKTLQPGQTYDLPRCIIQYLAEKGTPIYEKKTKADGTVEVIKKGKNPRFSLRLVYAA